MIQKTLLALAVAGVMASGSAFAQNAPLVMVTQSTPYSGITTGSFSAATQAGTADYSFSVGTTGQIDFSALFLSTVSVPGGYSLTNVAFDSNNFTKLFSSNSGTNSYSAWSYSGTNISAGTHTLTLTSTGSSSLGNNTGSIQFTSIVAAVPEPATITMMLAGLALVGGMQLRRKKKLELAG